MLSARKKCAIATAVLVLLISATIFAGWWRTTTSPLRLVWQTKHQVPHTWGPKNERRSLATTRFQEFAFSPDGKVLASYGQGWVCLWRLNDGRLQRSWRVGPDLIAGVDTIAFSGDGRQLVTLSGPILTYWRVEDGSQMRTLTLREAFPRTIGALSPDARRLAVGNHGDPGSIRIWQLEPERMELTWRAHNGRIQAIVFSPDGQFIATEGLEVPGDDRKSSKLWRVSDGILAGELATSMRNFALKKPAVSPQGHLQASVGDQGRRLYDRGNLIVEQSLGRTLEPGHPFFHASMKEVLPDYAAFSHDGRFVVVFDSRKRLSLFRLKLEQAGAR